MSRNDDSASGTNRAHVLVEEAFELAEEKLKQDEVTSEDVVEVGEALKKATEHPDQDIFVTLTAEGPKNQCLHHRHPEGPYAYPPGESPRECLAGIVSHEIEVTVS